MFIQKSPTPDIMNISNNCKINLKPSVAEILRGLSQEKLSIIRLLAVCELYEGVIIKETLKKIYPHQIHRVCVDILNYAKFHFENEPWFLIYVVLFKMVRMEKFDAFWIKENLPNRLKFDWIQCYLKQWNKECQTLTANVATKMEMDLNGDVILNGKQSQLKWKYRLPQQLNEIREEDVWQILILSQQMQFPYYIPSNYADIIDKVIISQSSIKNEIIYHRKNNEWIIPIEAEQLSLPQLLVQATNEQFIQQQTKPLNPSLIDIYDNGMSIFLLFQQQHKQ